MKKIIVAIAILGTFVVYSLGIRHENPVISKPSSANANTGATTVSTTSGSGTPSAATTTSSSSGTYKDGTYTGNAADAYYGNVKVSATISNGKITAVKFLEYPNTHNTSIAINQQAMPYLQQEAISAQSANVQIISGATFTSQAFQQSLRSALSQA